MQRSAAIALALSAAAIALPVSGWSADTTTLTGKDAFVTWKDAKPGLRYLIKPGDLPAPFATKSASNAPGTVDRPEGAKPTVPDGFSVDLVADGFQQPRVIRTAPNGDLFVADSSANTVTVLRMENGKLGQKSEFAANLNQPYGIAFYPAGDNPQWVYVANADSVVRFPYKSGDLKASGKAEQVISGVPANHHWTRDIVFSPDDKTLYLSVGSGSNIAEEVTDKPGNGIDAFMKAHSLGEMWGEEQGRAAVIAFDPDGKNRRVFATGIRNCSGMTLQPTTNALWCVTNERDGLGDNLVPDYATAVNEGAFYGWPWYYIGDNEDPRDPLKGQRPDLKGKVTVPDVLFQAHSAPLNITFYEGSMFPSEYKDSAFVTLHGSWNRGNRTGYKVVRMLFQDGKPTGEYEDFMTGFVVDDGNVWGRPVGVTVAQDGSLFVTEDGSGTIWRVSHQANPS
ncbi:MAG TPA: sorbosone dehydrogenase family protein [Bauldia sp.]|nr:sorbosone dehydrogenase family protein [Bauldia sp.]